MNADQASVFCLRSSAVHLRSSAANIFSFDDAKPFGHDREILGLHVPGLELGVQRLQANPPVAPLAVACRNLLAGVSLDGVARSVIQDSEALDEENLALARPARMEAEEIQAAIDRKSTRLNSSHL